MRVGKNNAREKWKKIISPTYARARNLYVSDYYWYRRSSYATIGKNVFGQTIEMCFFFFLLRLRTNFTLIRSGGEKWLLQELSKNEKFSKMQDDDGQKLLLKIVNKSSFIFIQR